MECLESKILRTKMSKSGLWILKVENWNSKSLCKAFENLKFEMSKFGFVNIKSWKLKFEIWTAI